KARLSVGILGFHDQRLGHSDAKHITTRAEDARRKPVKFPVYPFADMRVLGGALAAKLAMLFSEILQDRCRLVEIFVAVLKTWRLPVAVARKIFRLLVLAAA